MAVLSPEEIFAAVSILILMQFHVKWNVHTSRLWGLWQIRCLGDGLNLKKETMGRVRFSFLMSHFVRVGFFIGCIEAKQKRILFYNIVIIVMRLLIKCMLWSC